MINTIDLSIMGKYPIDWLIFKFALQLTFWIDINALRVLFEFILLNAEHLAVPVLVLQNVRILLTLEPRVLQIEEDWLGRATL